MSNINDTTNLPQDGSSNKYNPAEVGDKFNNRNNPLVTEDTFNGPNAKIKNDNFQQWVKEVPTLQKSNPARNPFGKSQIPRFDDFGDDESESDE